MSEASSSSNDLKLSLKVVVNKEKTKLLFAEADSQFVDILFSFLTLPLGRILKIFEKHYGDEAPTIGSLSSLYHGLANLDTSHFVTEAAKNTLLSPISSFEDEYKGLKLDISDSPPAEFFNCVLCDYRFRSESILYDYCFNCAKCEGDVEETMFLDVPTEEFTARLKARFKDGVFTKQQTLFVICDDLRIIPNEKGLLGAFSFLGTTEIDEVEAFGFHEIMNLLKASLTSPTPLSDVINKATQMKYSAIVASQPNISLPQPEIAKQETPNSKKVSLKVMTQKSTGKFLYAQAKKDFVEFLYSFLFIPVGGVEHLVAGKTCIKAVDNLYCSTNDLGDDYYSTFNFNKVKERLIQPLLPHGCISKDHILPLAEETLPYPYTDILMFFYSHKLPYGAGTYLDEPGTYEVKDDLTVMPFCIASILSNLREQKIPISDVEEVELQIGLKEGLHILKASLSSTTALSDALLTHSSIISNKRLKTI